MKHEAGKAELAVVDNTPPDPDEGGLSKVGYSLPQSVSTMVLFDRAPILYNGVEFALSALPASTPASMRQRTLHI
jgi:hypothetical protein